MSAVPLSSHSTSVNFNREVYCLLGLPFDAVSMKDVIQRVRDSAAQRTNCFISTPNLNFLIGCRTDSRFRESVINSDLSIADGMPLVWIARILGVPIPERVPGSGVFEGLRKDDSGHLSVYFFGGPDGVAARASERLNREASGIRCSGYASPGFGSIDDMSSESIINEINASAADFLLVSLGAKKGQAWIERNRRRISVPVISHLGAVVNFVAGRLKRAPAWMQHTGLEWLWRIKEEPTLWRRYFADGTAFIRLLVTRVAPQYWLIHRHGPAQQDLDASDISTEADNGSGETVLHLRGAWTRQNLRPLRECFSSAARTGTDLRIDLKQVSYVDAAFLGLLLLIHGSQEMNARHLSFEPLNRNMQRAFQLGCCEFLLADRRS